MRFTLAVFTYGNIHPMTMDSVMGEVDAAAQAKVEMLYTRIHDDALISRSRSKVMSDFLAHPETGDVLVQVDHDLAWDQGDVVGLAQQAALRQCMVAGMYSCRARGAGIAGRLASPRTAVHPGADERYDAEYLPGGFLAIPRMVLAEMLKNGGAEQKDPNLKITECIYLDGRPFYDFARCVAVPSTLVAGKHEMLSEDWSISYRARAANKARPQYLWAKPMLLHFGDYGFNLLEAGQAKPPATKIR